MRVELRTDQANDIRRLIHSEMNRLGYQPAYCVGILQILDNAESERVPSFLSVNYLELLNEEDKERAEIAKVYGPDLVDYVLSQRRT